MNIQPPNERSSDGPDGTDTQRHSFFNSIIHKQLARAKKTDVYQ